MQVGNRATKEVINGDLVVRYNGNNCTGGGRGGGAPTSPKGLNKAPRWVQKKAKEAVRRKAAEAEYTRRYLSG